MDVSQVGLRFRCLEVLVLVLVLVLSTRPQGGRTWAGKLHLFVLINQLVILRSTRLRRRALSPSSILFPIRHQSSRRRRRRRRLTR